MMAEPEFMLVTEAAALIRTPVSTMYGWHYRGQGPPALKIGRRLMYKRGDLLAWVDSQTSTRGDAA